jgi:hypothetical protein
LKVYWSKPETKKKVNQMTNVWSKVKNFANVRWRNRTRKEAKLISTWILLCICSILCWTFGCNNVLIGCQCVL